ncbi:MAG: SDR family NAD(P)-dependent oxidoreductase [Steroidobacteraceae bacterium]
MLLKSVILTGAAGGIGMEVLPLLVASGFVVYAGAIDEWEMSELERLKVQLRTDRILPVMLDLRQPEHIDAVIERVQSEHPELAGLLLNGAACPVPAPFEHLDLEITRDVYEIGLIGNLRLTQKCLPLMKVNKTRIIFTSSMWGLIPAHLVLSYSAYKHAAEAAFAIIRRELEPFGVSVIMVNPGGVKNTYMIAHHYYGTRVVIAEMDGCDPRELGPSHYDGGKNTNLKQQRQVPDPVYRPIQEAYYTSLIPLQAPDEMKFLATAADCGKAIVRALTARKPKRRYLVGGDVKVLAPIQRILGGAVIDKIFSAAFKPPKERR